MVVNRIQVHFPESLLPEVRAGLLELGIGGMTITCIHPKISVKGEHWILLEVLANPYEVEALIDALLEVLNRHPAMDGEICLQPLETVIRIRTGELDSDAIE